MKITRRLAVESDTEYAREVHHRAYREVIERQFGAWDGAEQDGFFAQDWGKGGFEIILCDGVPCGYMLVERRADYVQLWELVIDPDFHGQGIGSFLLREIQAEARARSLPVRLQTLHKNRAYELYRRMGFVDAGRTETHTLMQWG